MASLANFLHQTYPQMHTALKQSAFLSNEKGNTPEHTIPKLMERLMTTLSEGDERTPLQERFWERFIIKSDEIPESYRNLQKKILIERGQGGELENGELPQRMKKQLAEVLISDQRGSLARWTNYLSSPDAKYKPEMKYWIMRSILGLQSYDKKQQKFPKRTKGTVALFPELNQEALSLVINHKLQEIREEEPKKLTEAMTLEDWESYQKKKSFGDRYALALKATVKNHGEELKNIKGEWKKYPQESKPDKLVQSLEGQGTGWCTAGYNIAKTQLRLGDFYVYYSEDDQEKNTKPRLAIRMKGNKIAEIRGIGPDQELDPYITPVLEEKLKDFGNEADVYRQKAADMKMLTSIDEKTKKGEKLTDSELSFLYRFKPIIGFSQRSDDPRIDRLQQNPDILLQLGNAQDCECLNLSMLKSVRGLILPPNLKKLNLRSLEEIPEGLELPDGIEELDISSVKKIGEGVKWPKKLKKLDLRSMEEIPEGFIFPDGIEELDISSVKKIGEGVKWPKKLKKLDLRKLEEISAGFIFPDEVDELSLSAVNKIGEGVKWPKKSKKIYLLSLEEIPAGFIFPDEVDELGFYRVNKIGEGVKWPKKLKKLNLGSLKEITEGLELPDRIEELYLFLVKKIGDRTRLPKNLKKLDLSNLEEIPEGLELPDGIEELDLRSVTKIREGLKFPDNLEELNIYSRESLPDDFQIPKTLKSLIIDGKEVSVNQLKIHLWKRKIKAKINKLFSK